MPLRDQESPRPTARLKHQVVVCWLGNVVELLVLGHEGEGSRTWFTAPYPLLLYEVENGRVLFRDNSWNAG